MPSQQNQINLAKLFQSVTSTLVSNQQSLNKADTYNHDHGDNMVEAFSLISKAMQEKQKANPADQLAYASQLLAQRKSGSAQMYSKGLSQAAMDFKGTKQVTPDNAMSLIQALLGGGQAQSQQPQGGMGDLLGSLLGAGSETAQQSQNGSGDLLSALLGAAGNNSQVQSQNQQGSNGIDAADLLNAGMAFLNTKAQGGNNLEAIVNALVSGSAMGDSAHRSQSSTLVVNSLLQAISGMSGKK